MFIQKLNDTNLVVPDDVDTSKLFKDIEEYPDIF